MRSPLSCLGILIFCSHFKSPTGFPFNKDFEFKEIINYSILKMKDAGIHNIIRKRYLADDEKTAACGKRSEGSSLGIFGTISFFIILSLGIITSILLLILELIWRRLGVRMYNPYKIDI